MCTVYIVVKMYIELSYYSEAHYIVSIRSIYIVALSSKDNKRFILPDGIRTVALGMNEDDKNEFLTSAAIAA